MHPNRFNCLLRKGTEQDLAEAAQEIRADLGMIPPECRDQRGQLLWQLEKLENTSERKINRIKELIEEALQVPLPAAPVLCTVEGVNRFERNFAEILSAAGFTVLRSGWPDLLAHNADQVIAVEVKQGRDRVSSRQAAMHRALASAGIPVLIVRNPRALQKRLARWNQIPVCKRRGQSGKGRRKTGNIIYEALEDVELDDLFTARRG